MSLSPSATQFFRNRENIAAPPPRSDPRKATAIITSLTMPRIDSDELHSDLYSGADLSNVPAVPPRLTQATPQLGQCVLPFDSDFVNSFLQFEHS